jgi:hypothetical protein
MPSNYERRIQIRRFPQPHPKDKAVVRLSSLSASSGERAGVKCRCLHSLRQDGLKVWFDEWEIPVASVCDRTVEGGRSQSAATVAKIKEGPFKFGTRKSQFGIPRLCMSAHAFGLDWAQLEAGTFRFRDPLKKQGHSVNLWELLPLAPSKS